MRYSYLLVLELDESRLIHHNFVPFIHACLEQLRQCEPLSGHLVAVVRVHELVVVDAVGRVALNTAARRLARVEGDNVIEQRLAVRQEVDRLGRVWVVVVRGVRLADLEVLAREGRVCRERVCGRRVPGHGAMSAASESCNAR